MNLKRIGLIVFAVTLGPHKDKIETDKFFLKNIIFGLEKPKNGNVFENLIQFFTTTTFHIIVRK